MSVLQVASILPLADGKILVAGVFTNFSGTSRVGIVRLEASGNLDTTFSRVTTTTQTGVPIGIVGAALQADGKIVIVGDFPRISDNNYPAGVARLNADGTLDGSFQPSGFTRMTAVRSAVIQPDGKIVVGGRFSVPASFASNPTGATYANLPLVRLNSDGTVDQSYGHFTMRGDLPFIIRHIALSGDKVVAADFGNYKTLFRFNANGSLDPTFRQPLFLIDQTSGGVAAPYYVTVQPDGGVLVSGVFTDVDNEGGSSSVPRYGSRASM